MDDEKYKQNNLIIPYIEVDDNPNLPTNLYNDSNVFYIRNKNKEYINYKQIKTINTGLIFKIPRLVQNANEKFNYTIHGRLHHTREMAVDYGVILIDPFIITPETDFILQLTYKNISANNAAIPPGTLIAELYFEMTLNVNLENVIYNRS